MTRRALGISCFVQLQDANSRLGEMAGWLDEERRRSDGLLYQMLPPEVASCLKNEERAPAQEHPEVSGWLRTHIDWDGVDARVHSCRDGGWPTSSWDVSCRGSVWVQGCRYHEIDNAAARTSKRVALPVSSQATVLFSDIVGELDVTARD
mgnify:CR=1 FL=1